MPSPDLTGIQFGRLTAIERTTKGPQGHIRWLCRCECGAILPVMASHLVSGHSKSCGCFHPNFQDLTGQRFGRWTVIERQGQSRKRSAHWLCQCDCGNTALVASDSLVSGHSTSCGCAHIDAVTTHNRTHTPEYRAWASMKSRCYRKTDISYPRYGALGVRVCDRWLNSFENFLADMGERPSSKHSLDRIDSRGNYEPTNCQWSDIATQNSNRRSNRQITWNGTTRTVSQWAEELGISRSTIFNRLRLGWAEESALTTPVEKRR